VPASRNLQENFLQLKRAVKARKKTKPETRNILSMILWQHISNELSAGKNVLLLCVVDSEGSSPGRRGFKMAVSQDGAISGTIGGGAMEFKLVEVAKAQLKANEKKISVVVQYHDKEHKKDRSGMICSGNQTIALIPLGKEALPLVTKLCQPEELPFNSFLVFHNKGIKLVEETMETGFLQKENGLWSYTERVKQAAVIHIIGGGHVSLALSEMMHYLGFYVKVYDNRPGLNTMESNKFANEKILADYENIGEIIPSGLSEFLVIMTMGYRDDLKVLKQLLQKDFFYLGMLGSEFKTATLLNELKADGVDAAIFEKYFIPVGLNILSKTPKEIAVSIAAQIILEKNRHLPTGRKAKPVSDE
jgi:xanthine dehydrogenase accessory factor